MAYKKYKQITWLNEATDGTIPDGAPSMNADNLNRMEFGISKSFSKDIGFISFYCKATPPDGWLVCDGSAVSRTDYEDLFLCIGTNFGVGDGKTTFNLPDLRGEFIRGWNSSLSGYDANREFGSKQEATEFCHASNTVKYVGNGEGEGSTKTFGTYYGSYNYDHTTFNIRPNNIALLPCIFTGVFHEEE